MAEHTHQEEEEGRQERRVQTLKSDRPGFSSSSSSALISICATLSKGVELLSTLQGTVRVPTVPESQDYCKDLIR